MLMSEARSSNGVVYLHVGVHKTGTTTIQSALSVSFDSLRKSGILYPVSGRPKHLSDCHHSLAWALRRERGVSMDEWCQLKREIENSGLSRIVISSEEFVFLNQKEILKLKDQLRNFKVYVIFYLRNPLDFLQSYYKELVKRNMYSGSFRRFLTSRQVDYVQFFSLIEKWSSVFSTSMIQVRSYDEAIRRGSVVEDFVSLFLKGDIAHFRELDTQLNVSPENGTIRFISRMNYIENWLKQMEASLGSTLYLARGVGVLRRRIYPSSFINRLMYKLNLVFGHRSLYSEQDIVSLREFWWHTNGDLFEKYLPKTGRSHFRF